MGLPPHAPAMPCSGLAVLLLLVQNGSIVGPSPPPKRYDPEHDALLARAWDRRTLPLKEQKDPIRPEVWRVRSSPDSDAMLRYAVRGEIGIGDEVREVRAGENLTRLGVAETIVNVSEAQVRFVRAPGVETVLVNGTGFIGDPERRGDLGVPVTLEAGENRIVLLGLRSGTLDVEFWDPVPRLVMATWALEVGPSLPGGPREWPNSWAALFVPVFNADPRRAYMNFTYGRAKPPGARPPSLAKSNPGGFVAPLGLRRVSSYLFDVGTDAWECEEVLAPIRVSDENDDADHRHLVPLSMTGPAPRRPLREPTHWPVASIDASTYFVYETWGPSDVAREALATARYCQQLVWYRTGRIPVLVPSHPEWEARSDELIIRFGYSASEPAGVLVARQDERAKFSLRASDAAGMRLVYAIDPLFSDITENPTRFKLP